jgi:DNA-directed RNA polymerase subunit RPC12/RpoP
MAEEGGSQRHYRAPCPGCGAPVEFRSAQSAFAVCPYCQSTVLRQGETLTRIGKMAELFDDFSPLQLLASGRVQEQSFTLVGRLQYAYEGGRWTEWIAALGADRTGILSEDNGAFVFVVPLQLQRAAPPAADLRVGATTAIDGASYTVASNEAVALVSAQGELPRLPELGRQFAVVELRNDQGQVLSLSYDSDPPGAYLGRAVRLEDLQLSGLRDESARDEKGRAFNCPNCGAPVTVNLADSKSITCPSCHSIIDLSQGIGGELRHATQDEPIRPLIAIGSVGRLQGVDWQVVGFQHRMGAAPGDDERFGWSEYLLYNQKRGFSFLVDAEDGWSMVKPTTGAPVMAEDGSRASYLGTRYALRYAYNAETTYVLGEFYWQVERGQQTFNRDFANGAALLSMERSPRELTWSSGNTIDSAAVAAAFKLDARKEMFKRSDALPLSGSPRLGCGTVILIMVTIVILLIILSTCSSSGGGGYYYGGSRSAGGSYGGYSSGGGHK